MSAATRRLAEPLHVPGPQGPWGPVRGSLEDTGSAVVYGTLSTWRSQLQEPDRLRPLLGRDWSRYQSLRNARARERFLASRLLLRQTTAEVIGSAPELVDLAYQPGGRPYVRGCDQIDISLSHTEEIMAVGVTRRGRIGVDVELMERRLAGTESESVGFTPYERERLDRADPRLRNDILVRLWTLKEAYSKALGQGLRFRFTEFGFALDGSAARLVQPDGAPVGDGASWTFGTFVLDRPGQATGYMLSAAVQDSGFGDSVDLSVATAVDEGLLETMMRSAYRAQSA
jgi:4'-phosphopantetheinyl transferase